MDHSRGKKDDSRQNRREFFLEIAKVTGAVGLTSSLPARALAQDGHIVARENGAAFSSLSSELVAGWLNPARTYRPHTRWWWPGNAVTKDGIIWELDQMHQQGMGGVEIMSCLLPHTRVAGEVLERDHMEVLYRLLHNESRIAGHPLGVPWTS